jgi:NAD(P)-dependent dehydrogenase (short-subunit alcohol dehydrogenase family)
MSISTWLITGASSGLGYALAERVLKQGNQVVLWRQSEDHSSYCSHKPFFSYSRTERP